MTSPTYDARQKSLKRMYFDFVGPFWDGYRNPTPPAIRALEPWFEVGEGSWCAAPAVAELNDPNAVPDDPRLELSAPPLLQLGIVMPFAIVPEEIVIEYVPRLATPDPGSAPRKLELWVSIANATARAAAQSELSRIYAMGPEQADVPASDRMSGIALNDTFIRLSRFEYDINRGDANHIQTFGVYVDLEKYGVSVREVVVRATSNWGKGWTCLYRVRVFGRRVKEVEEVVLGEEWDGEMSL